MLKTKRQRTVAVRGGLECSESHKGVTGEMVEGDSECAVGDMPALRSSVLPNEASVLCSLGKSPCMPISYVGLGLVNCAHTWTDKHQLISLCFPLGLSTFTVAPP